MRYRAFQIQDLQIPCHVLLGFKSVEMLKANSVMLGLIQ
jgi:hypothetical protein